MSMSAEKKNTQAQEKSENEQEANRQEQEPCVEQEESESPLEQKNLELQAELESLQTQLQESKNDYLRSLADMENVRKRSEKERQDSLKFGTQDLINKLLPVFDSFDKAMLSINTDQDDAASYQALSQGLKLVDSQLKESLDQIGVCKIGEAGDAFDPNLHEAVQKIESDEVKEVLVKEVFVKGYTLNGRLLRAAMVSVVSPKGS